MQGQEQAEQTGAGCRDRQGQGRGRWDGRDRGRTEAEAAAGCSKPELSSVLSLLRTLFAKINFTACLPVMNWASPARLAWWLKESYCLVMVIGADL